MIAKNFGQISEGRDNNFDFLRFFFATLVIFSHSFAMLYNGTWYAYDPLLHWTRGQVAFGGGAVDGFFLISGFLITKSWERSRGVGDFTKKRALRILPALAVVLVATVFVLGPLATSLPLASYFHSSRAYAYFTFMGTRNLHLTDTLPGVFTHNPLADRVNGSLWTIRCEVICYIMVAVLGLLRCYRRPALMLLASIAAVIVTALGAKHLATMGEWSDSFRVLIYFLWGMTFYLYRGVIPCSRALLLTCLAGAVASDLIGILPYTLPLLGAYGLFYAAFSPRLRLQSFAKHGDFSYGLYLYAFPVQQLLVSRFRPALNAETLSLTAFLIAGTCAVLSWYGVEKRWLRRKANLPRVLSPEDNADGTRTVAVAGQAV